MRHRLYVHITWTTRDRAPLINQGIARFLSRFLPAVAQQERCKVLALGMVQAHLHLLVRLHPMTSIPRLVQRLKGGSGVIANKEGHAGDVELKWAKGYNIQSVSVRALDRVAAYVNDQPRHHPTERIASSPIEVASRDS